MTSLGLQCLQDVYSALMVDDEWAVWGERSFTWWAGDLAQTIEALPDEEWDGDTVAGLVASTPVVVDPQRRLLPEPKVTAVNLVLCLCGATLSADGTSVALVSRLRMYGELVDPHVRLFAFAAGLQVALAHTLAESIASALDQPVATSAHPTSGRRADPDGLLTIIPRLIQPAGEGPSAFTPEDITAAAMVLKDLGLQDVASSDAGLRVDLLPFLGPGAAVEVSRTMRHPAFGSGLATRLLLPGRGPDAAGLLNWFDVASHPMSSFLGGWVPQEDGVGFLAFYPNVVHKTNLATNLCIDQLVRARWFAELVSDVSRLRAQSDRTC